MQFAIDPVEQQKKESDEENALSVHRCGLFTTTYRSPMTLKLNIEGAKIYQCYKQFLTFFIPEKCKKILLHPNIKAPFSFAWKKSVMYSSP